MRQKESELQQSCVKWFRYAYPRQSQVLFAVPNGGYRNIATARKLKAEGVTPGVSDLILLVPKHGYHGLCIEMKHGKGRQSPKQVAWEKAVKKQGYHYVVVRSFAGFCQLIKDYLHGG